MPATSERTANDIADNRLDIRHPIPEVGHDYPTARDAFDAGGYAVALDLAIREKDRPMEALATILCGPVRRGLEMLGEPASDLAKLVGGYGQWCLNETESALELWADPGEGEFANAAARLLGYANNPLDVLIFASPGAGRGGHYRDVPGFRTEIVEIGPDDIGVHINAVMDRLPSDFSPVFALSVDAFGAFLPEGLHEAPFPVAIWSTDHDFYLTSRYEDFQAADLLLVHFAQDQWEMNRIYGGRVAAMPGHEQIDQRTDFGRPAAEKDIDILFTGRAFTPYMRDKARYIFGLATLEDPDLRVEVINGYVPEENYTDAVRRARLVPIYCRYAGGIQQRGLDSLRQGTPVLSPEQSLYRRLLGEEAAGYRTAPEKLSREAIEKLFDGGWASPNRRAFRELHWPSPTREQRFLKFCLFQLALMGGGRNNRPGRTHIPAEQRGYNAETGTAVYGRIASHNLSEGAVTAARFNAAANAAFYAALLVEDAENLAPLALETYERGIESFPASLALRFNRAASLWLLGALPESAQAFEELAADNHGFDPNPAANHLLSHRILRLSERLTYDDLYWAQVSRQIGRPDRAPEDILMAGVLVFLAEIDLAAGRTGEARSQASGALKLHDRNFAAWRLLAELEPDPTAALPAFYRAVNLYPPLLSGLLPIGIDGELAAGRDDKAAQILTKFALFYLRTRTADGALMEVPDASLEMLRLHRSLLPDWLKDRLAAGGL